MRCRLWIMHFPRTCRHPFVFVLALLFIWITRHFSYRCIRTAAAKYGFTAKSKPTVSQHEKYPSDFAHSHPLENSCRYPILEPEDESLKAYIEHGFRVTCAHTQAELVTLDEETGILRFDQARAERTFNETITCYYRTFDGGIAPYHLHTRPLMPWSQLRNEVSIQDDIAEVKCFNARSKLLVYRDDFMRVAPRKVAYSQNSKTRLSLDILAIDSTSLNMFRRHAPLSWDYMTKVMGFFVFEGYTKVGDNSLLNIIPLLTGLRYKDAGPGMPSDIPMDQPLDTDATSFLWHAFKAKNCATLFADDIGSIVRGTFNYPFPLVPGFKSKPTEHFYRPWRLYQFLYPIPKSSQFCYGNKMIFNAQLGLTKQMIKRYTDKCHFSFNFITDLAHTESKHLEALDEEIQKTLKQLFEGGYLKHTVLAIMGDHGLRLGPMTYTYIGRIEERMPLFAVYMPEWFRSAHPDIERNLVTNRHRLTTHFDAHEMFRDISEENFSGANKKMECGHRRVKGISLFRPISPRRTCTEANVPLHCCVCMIRNRTLTNKGGDTLLRNWALNRLAQWVVDNHSEKMLSYNITLPRVIITQMYALTTNQYVQHGVRNISDAEEINMTVGWEWRKGDIEYLETEFFIEHFGMSGIARFQHNMVLKTVVLNMKPYIITG